MSKFIQKYECFVSIVDSRFSDVGRRIYFANGLKYQNKTEPLPLSKHWKSLHIKYSLFAAVAVVVVVVSASKRAKVFRNEAAKYFVYFIETGSVRLLSTAGDRYSNCNISFGGFPSAET